MGSDTSSIRSSSSKHQVLQLATLDPKDPPVSILKTSKKKPIPKDRYEMDQIRKINEEQLLKLSNLGAAQMSVTSGSRNPMQQSMDV